ncbi:hypothetical protein HYDPIDRAFT_24226 [Hydnomerulius pinastri MD-312]|nr:hypothetical protein HYDPIDRAFT_24226 [Hydnomerulius pinastri MD-312]
MPFVKCRYYSESGEPWKGGCRRRGSGCTFVHPDETGWASASAAASFGGKGRGGGDSGSFRGGGERGGGRGRGGASTSTSGWDLSGNSGGGGGGGGGWDTGGGSGWDTGGGSGWDTGGGSGWDTGGGSGGGGGWDTGGPATASTNEKTSSKSKTITDLADAWGQADATANYSWGGGSGGGWGSTSWGNSSGGAEEKPKSPLSGRGESSWGNSGGGNDNGNSTGGGWGSSGGGGWGAAKDTEKAAETKEKDGWGSSTTGDTWGKGQSSSWPSSGWGGASSGTTVEDQKEKPAQSDKGKGKALLPPPRPPRPSVSVSDDRPAPPIKMTGTNNVPITGNRWGDTASTVKPTPRVDTNVPTAMEFDSVPTMDKTPYSALDPQPLSARPSDGRSRTARESDTPITPAADSSRRKRKRGDAFEEKMDIFKEYVKAWERGVRAKFLLADAEAKRDRWHRTQKSPCYTRIGEAGRKKLDAQRAEYDKEVSIQREKLSSAITSLVEFHDNMASNLDLGQRYNIGEEATRYLAESKGFIDEVRSLLVTHVLKATSPQSEKESDSNSPDEDISSTPEDLRLLLHQIHDLEERLEEAQTELTLRHPRDIRAEIDEKLNVKLAALRAARQREVDRVASLPRPEIVIPPAALQRMEETAQQVKALDAKLPQTVEDIRDLILQVNATKARVEKLEAEVAESRELVRKREEDKVALREIERRTEEGLSQFREQFEKLTTSAPPASDTSIKNTQEEFIESLRPGFEALLEKFYESNVLPTLDAIGKNVLETADRNQQETVGVLWGKMQPAMNMVDGVSRWLDSQELALTAPTD